ncbi:MAG TPA: succinate dehydrogenase cytochrome b subunit [Ignavibacteria bacterium]|nr:succinate dehydrogenase cytochrome b subunit [Ignavibacteria bacterium]HQY51971.1 succinate dehydrogenase cytochrome b subunit [Ignavibacteria bacterium]HRB00922.1 succinate dehydrogenase cytochrome b subunit [Ignavibacteria bacterium]
MTTFLSGIFSKSVGKKFAMGITGLFLISFLIVHCAINATIFLNDGGNLFNVTAHFMGTNIFIRTMEIVLFAGIIWHIVQALIVTRDNKKANSIKYNVFDGKANSRWYSRWMGLLGTLILMFLILHLLHFWLQTRFTGLGLPPVMIDGKEYENIYGKMLEVFSIGWVVVVYVLGMISLAYHLLHGFQSAFQSMGLNNKKYTPLIKLTGKLFSILIPLIFALMPIAIYFGFLK